MIGYRKKVSGLKIEHVLIKVYIINNKNGVDVDRDYKIMEFCV